MAAETQGDMNMPVTFEKARVNVWNIVGFVVMIAGSAFGWGVTWASTNNGISALASKVEKIEDKMPDVAALQYQMTTVSTIAVENKKANEETNKRIDRVVDSVNGKLDTVISVLNKTATDVEVLKNREGLRK